MSDYMGPRSLDPSCQDEDTVWLYTCKECCSDWTSDDDALTECPVCNGNRVTIKAALPHQTRLASDMDGGAA